jgi:hypothetical protein
MTAAAAITAIGGLIGKMLPSTTTTNTSGSQNAQGTNTTNVTSALGTGAASKLNSQLKDGTYSKAAAISDSNAAVANAIKVLMQNYAPSIASNQAGAGIFNSTQTGEQMSQLEGNAAAAGAQETLTQIVNYMQNQNQLAGILSNANQQVTQNSTQTQQSSSQSTQNSGMTVICTRLHELGYITTEQLADDSIYGMYILMTEPDLYHWYIEWANKYIVPRMVSKDNLFTKAVWFIAKYWIKHMEHMVDSNKPDSIIGRSIINAGRLVVSIKHLTGISHSVGA